MNTLMRSLLLVLSLVVIVSLVVETSAAETYRFADSIGIALSPTCVRLVATDNPGNCPTIKELYDLQLDTSNTKISGDFKIVNGIFQRDTSNLPMVNHYNWYKQFFDKMMYFIDPPGDMRDRIKMITLVTHLEGYTLPGDLKKVNHTRTLNEVRYVDDKCRNAVLVVDEWEKTLFDTIHYMIHNCSTKETQLITRYTITDPVMDHDITTSAKWQLENRTNWIKENCLKEYGKCK